jgi:hypothetical protein
MRVLFAFLTVPVVGCALRSGTSARRGRIPLAQLQGKSARPHSGAVTAKCSDSTARKGRRLHEQSPSREHPCRDPKTCASSLMDRDNAV